MLYDKLNAIFNDHQGRLFLLSPEYDYMNLLDYDAKYSLYHSSPHKSKPGTSSFQIWREELIGKTKNSDSSFFPHLPGLHLIDLSSKYQFLTSSAINERYGFWTDHFDEYAHQMYRIYEKCAHYILRNSMCTNMTMLFTNRVQVFRTFKLGRNPHVAMEFVKTILDNMYCNSFTRGDIVVDLLKATCITRKLKEILFTHLLFWLEGWCVYRAARQAGFDFWGLWSVDFRNKHRLDRYCPVTRAFIHGTSSIMELLLRNGFQFDLRPVPEEISLDFFKSHSHIDCSVANLPRAINHRTVVMFLLFMFVHQDTLRHMWPTESFDDDFQVKFFDSPLEPEKLADNLAKFWRVYPGPFMGREEFMQIAHDLFRVHHPYLAYAECAYRVNVALSPEHYRTGPRSLMHLSRCVLRKVLHERSDSMDIAISDLKIPENLMWYLYLEC